MRRGVYWYWIPIQHVVVNKSISLYPPSPSNFLQKAIYLVAVRLKVVLELKLELNIIFLEFYTRPVRRLRVLVVPRAEAKTEAEAEAVVEVLLTRE